MKTRNRINVKTAQQYLQSHQKFTASQARAIQQEPNSFYLEINAKFLPETLILTVLMDSKLAGPTYHLTIIN